MAASIWRGFCELAAESRNASGFPCISCSKIGKSRRRARASSFWAAGETEAIPAIVTAGLIATSQRPHMRLSSRPATLRPHDGQGLPHRASPGAGAASEDRGGRAHPARLRRRLRRREGARSRPREGPGEAAGGAGLVRARRAPQRRPGRPDRPGGAAAAGLDRHLVSAPVVHRFRAMGCEAALAGGDPQRVAAVLERWEDAFSLFRPRSELSRLNRSPARIVAVSALFASALRVALEVAAETDGLLDPTLCGRWRELVLAGRLLQRPPGLALDLNGVTKSLAVDEAAATLAGPGFVSVGGDLAVRGPVDVALPGGGAVRVVEGGLATRGTASRRSCLAADVAAKVGFLLGEQGPAWLDERGIPGRFLAPGGEVVENETWARATLGAACT